MPSSQAGHVVGIRGSLLCFNFSLLSQILATITWILAHGFLTVSILIYLAGVAQRSSNADEVSQCSAAGRNPKCTSAANLCQSQDLPPCILRLILPARPASEKLCETVERMTSAWS